MRYLSEAEATRMMGLGDDVGDLYQDLDGYLYEWVEGVDEWGNSVGFLQGLSEPEVAELRGLGALYEAPDGKLFQVQGLAEEEQADEAMEAENSSESQAPSGMAPLRQIAPTRRLHPRIRVRRRLRGRPSQRPGPGARGGPLRKKGGFLKKLLPIAKIASKFIPIPGVQQLVTGGIDVASKLLKKPGVAGYAGLGALYLGDDGTVYQVQGLDEENFGALYADEELRGFAEDDELRGLEDDEELRGFAEDEDLRGFAEDEELRGLDEDEELRGLEQGYVRENAVGGLEAYVPARRPETRWFKPPSEPPEVWKPLW